jgi:hypothetical protein
VKTAFLSEMKGQSLASFSLNICNILQGPIL